MGCDRFTLLSHFNNTERATGQAAESNPHEVGKAVGHGKRLFPDGLTDAAVFRWLGDLSTV